MKESPATAAKSRAKPTGFDVSPGLFRLIFDTSPDIVTINRFKDGAYIEINETFTKVTGFTRQDVLGNTSLGIEIWTDPQDRLRLIAGLREEGADGVVRNLEAAFRMKDGTIRTGLVSAAMMIFAGEPHLLTLTRDITKWVQTTEELQRSAARLEILHTIDVAVLEARSVDGMCETVLDGLAMLIPAERASIAIFDEEAGDAAVFARGVLEDTMGRERRVSLAGVFSEIERLRAGEVVMVDDLEDADGLDTGLTRLRDAGIRSVTNIPLRAHGVLLGSLNFGFNHPGGFSERNLDIGRELADSIAVALEQARLRGVLERHTWELEQRVAERTDELRRAVTLMAGREIRMAELKQDINALRRQLHAAGIEPAAGDSLARGGE